MSYKIERKIARGRDWIAYHLFHEAEGGGLPRDPYVACGRLRCSHGACAAWGRRGVRRRRRRDRVPRSPELTEEEGAERETLVRGGKAF
jgi:hypothetical protein